MVPGCRRLRPSTRQGVKAVNCVVDHDFSAVHVVGEAPMRRLFPAFFLCAASANHWRTRSVVNDLVVNLGNDFPQVFTLDSTGGFSVTRGLWWNLAEYVHFDPGLDLGQITLRRNHF